MNRAAPPLVQQLLLMYSMFILCMPAMMAMLALLANVDRQSKQLLQLTAHMSLHQAKAGVAGPAACHCTCTRASSRVMGARLKVLVRTISGNAAGSWSVGSSSTKSSASLGRDCMHKHFILSSKLQLHI